MLLPLGMIWRVVEHLFPGRSMGLEEWGFVIVGAVGFMVTYTCLSLFLYNMQEKSLSAREWTKLRKELDQGLPQKLEDDSQKTMMP